MSSETKRVTINFLKIVWKCYLSSLALVLFISALQRSYLFEASILGMFVVMAILDWVWVIETGEL